MVAKHVRAALRVLRTQVELGRVRLPTSTTCVPHFFVFVSSSVWHGPGVWQHRGQVPAEHDKGKHQGPHATGLVVLAPVLLPSCLSSTGVLLPVLGTD